MSTQQENFDPVASSGKFSTNKKTGLLLVVFVLAIISAIGFIYKQQNKVLPIVLSPVSPEKPASDLVSLDGIYVLDSGSPYHSSRIEVTNSSETELTYNIETLNFGHFGTLGGTAKRAEGSELVYKDLITADYPEGSICSVMIIFPDTEHASYTTEGDGCDSYHGAHGTFFDGDVHLKNGLITLPTIEEFGFTKKDDEALKNISKEGIFSAVEGYIGIESTLTKKFKSIDIPGAVGYSIETANLYDGTFPCDDFSASGGLCKFAAFLKDVNGNYWLLEGTNDGEFKYSSTSKEWQKKMPKVFETELERIGVPVSNVVFEN